jgi:microcystin-dependent protein
VPTGYLECDGAAVSRTTYADLFAIISTTYGVGDGSSTFNVPDLQDNVAMGKSGTKAIASTGGANTVSSSGTVSTNVSGTIGGTTANATLSTAQLASHSHSTSIKSGTGAPDAGPGLTKSNSGTANYGSNNTGSGTGHSHNMSATFSGTSSSTFSGTASSVVQPYLTIMYIIKT